MTNTSIKNAFYRFWQHVVALVGVKANRDEVVDLTSNQTVNGIKTFEDGIQIGDITVTHDTENHRLVVNIP